MTEIFVFIHKRAFRSQCKAKIGYINNTSAFYKTQRKILQ